MLDSTVRPIIDPPLDHIGRFLSRQGISANTMTFMGFGCGLAAILLIIQGEYLWGVFFITLNRLCDGLDGAIARVRGLTDFGGLLDIVCDFIVYAGVVFSFGVHDPDKLIYAAFLVLSFMGPITSFLAYGIIAAKREVTIDIRGQKSFYYMGGICEGTETFATLVLLCFLPEYFDIICITYGVLCWMTTMGRVYYAWKDFT